MKAELTSPYTITEEGVYVGYSFTIDELNEYTKTPLLLSSSVNENGLYVHTSQTVKKWRNYGIDYLNASAVISVTIDGDFPENSIEPKSLETIYGKVGETGSASIEILNCGVEAVNEIGYTYKIGDVTKSANEKLLSPIKNDFFNTSSAILSFEMPEEIGEYDIEVTIDKVNGKENSSKNRTVSTKLFTVNSVPVRIPVMEEYTYTTCGYCTRGWFAIDKMNKLHGDDFIALVYHRKDPMAIIPEADYPKQINGWPAATLDRGSVIDPYFGYAKEPFGIEKAWEEARKVFSPADVSVRVQWGNDDKTTLEANSSVSFVIQEDNADYRLSYVLCANGLHSNDPMWAQHNYYAEPGEAAQVAGTELEELSKLPELINDFHYNEVVIASNDLHGEKSILPESTTVGEKIEHSYTFTVTDNIKPFINMAESLFVVAMVIDGETGKIVNAAKSELVLESGVGTVNGEVHGDVVGECYTDLLGRNVVNPAGGIFVRTVKYSDGTVKSEKVLIK